MATESYRDINFTAESLKMIRTINGIVEAYVKQGFRLTARQIYYQLVARALIENTERSYKRITGLINDAKLSGYTDWDAIEDRTREFLRRTRWGSGGELLNACAKQFHMDHWVGQDARVFVIIEKEALVGVLERVCKRYDVPLLAARGYPSGTVLREFVVEDVVPALEDGHAVTILHLGDHDPSGIDMTRDLGERIDLFARSEEMEYEIDVMRIALNMDQIVRHRPPPNPAKMTDPRFKQYIKDYGQKSWELDALEPELLEQLVDTHIDRHIDQGAWKARHEEIEAVRKRLQVLADAFDKERPDA